MQVGCTWGVGRRMSWVCSCMRGVVTHTASKWGPCHDVVMHTVAALCTRRGHRCW
jgi:hypothetical protein